MQKADKNIAEQRVKDIARLLINGSSREDIILHCSVNWNIGERQTDKYVLRAKTLVEQSEKKN